jgi:SAM-dependent methyltransferase
VGGRVEDVQGDVEALADAVGARHFDLVLAHGIFAAVDDVAAAFAAIAGCVRPGGSLSVLAANPVASVLARAMAGELPAALQELRALAEASTAQGAPDGVRSLCAEHGLLVEAEHGIGVFGDLVPGRALDGPGARESLDELEALAAARPPFRDIAARVHLLARRPAG